MRKNICQNEKVTRALGSGLCTVKNGKHTDYKNVSSFVLKDIITFIIVMKSDESVMHRHIF